MRLFFHLMVVVPVAVIAFVAFTVATTAEWIREASAVKTPILVSATQRARLLRRRI